MSGKELLSSIIGNSFSFLLSFCILHPAISQLDEFDLEPFLDPQVSKIQESILPIYDSNSFNSATHLHNVTPKKGNSSEFNSGEKRQLSLRPTEAFITRRSINTSCAFTIPLFIFTLPTAAPFDEELPTNISNQMVYALFAIMYTVASFIVPVVFSGIRDPTVTGRSDTEEGSQSILNRLLDNSHRPMIDFMGVGNKYRIGLDPKSCLLQTICLANRDEDSREYGMVSLPFQFFYPPPPLNGTNERSLTPVEEAAKIGSFDRNMECGSKYKCPIDYLQLVSSLWNVLQYYLRKRKGNYDIN